MDEYLYFILLVEYEGVPIIVRGVEHTVEQGIFWSIYTDDLSPAAQNDDFLKFMSQKWKKIKKMIQQINYRLVRQCLSD